MTVTDADRLEEMRRRYLADHVRTASPGQRLLMLFDRLLHDLHSAERAFVEMDRKAINDDLVHAQQILFALRDPLDLTTEIGRNLGGLYDYCLTRLLTANLEKDVSLLAECVEILEQIRDANRRVVDSAGLEVTVAG
ncbi:MAG TPA: flagellar export chaperone FliS [Acidimicrobiales bacterium]|nr:flagellar export chaperone FliS [Acidimicrobiales bacterium]